MYGFYKPKGETVAAWQVSLGSADWIAQQVGGTVVNEYGPDGQQPGINVPTLDGPERACLDDFVVKHQNGKVEIMKFHEFHEKYEET